MGGHQTTENATPLPSTKDATKFAPSISHSPETQAEIDKLIFQIPPAMWNPAQEKQISPFSPAQAPSKIETSIQWPQSVPIPIPGTAIPEIPPLTYPNEPTISIPATIIPGVDGAPPIIITGTGEEALPDLYKSPEPIDETGSDPDIPYNPNSLNGPYTLPEVDFGQRLKDFVTAVKGTSIFSLPNSVFGNIPGAGNSQMTINGGQIFGTHIFDFADLSSMWLVLRGIVLIGFSFIAVRVVCLKK